MRYTKLVVVTLLSWGLLAETAAAAPKCIVFAGTADAFRRQRAIDDSRTVLEQTIAKWRLDNQISGPMSVTAERPDPRPYWRGSISEDLFYKPDDVTDTVYTLCWRGVVSPVVCTSGSKVCWGS
jgi:hypothetical protein